MASSTVILEIISRNMGFIAGSYVHDDECSGKLALFEKLDLSDTLKNT